MSNIKIKYLDGIRGIMAINVVISHYVMVFFPQMFYKDFVSKDILSLFAYTPLSMFCNGNIAVQFFLVLTGFLVSRSVILKKNQSNSEIITKACNRYFRLLPVVFMATLFAFLTKVFDLQYQLNIIDIAKNGVILQNSCNFKPTVINLIKDVFIDSFFNSSAYLVPFWTIRFELWGYIICLVACYLLKDNKWRRIAYVLIAIFVGRKLSLFYFSFLFGVFVADLIFENRKNSTVLSPFYYNLINKKIFSVLCTVFGLLFISAPTVSISQSIILVMFVEYAWLFRAIGWSLLIFSTMKMKRTQRFFEMKLFQWLGKISFEVYGIHWTIMLVVETRLFEFLQKRISYNISGLLTFGLSLILILVASHGLHLLIEKWNKSRFNLTKLLHKIKLIQTEI